MSATYGSRPGAGPAYRRRLASFGGRDGSGTALGDTWTWNGTTWVPLYAAGPGQPPARGGAMGATDTNGSIVMFGGGTPAQLNDLWRLS